MGEVVKTNERIVLNMVFERTICATLAFDESGAKGYANQQEKFPGEVGVVAGILIHEEVADKTCAVFQEILSKYNPNSTSKLHITDLDAATQEALRCDVYEAIVQFQLPCFWYALHVQGLFEDHFALQKLLQTTRSTSSPRFKRGSPREVKALLHEKLFIGLFANVLALFESREIVNVDLLIKTDRIDKAILKRFERAAEEFLDDGAQVSSVSALDTETDKIVTGSVTIEVNYPDSLKLRTKVQGTKVQCSEDGETLAADVLANSLNHLYVNRCPDDKYKPLNEFAAIQQHPIAQYFHSLGNSSGGDIVGDRLLAHPNSPKSR